MTAPDALPAARTHADHRVQLEAVYWFFAGISTTFIALRIFARVSRRKLGIDDWLMVACWVRITWDTVKIPAHTAQVLTLTQLSFIATGALVTLIAETGGTRHKEALTISELEYQMKLQTIILVFWIATTLLGSLAIGCTILSLLKRTDKWHTWPVYIVIHFMAITCVLDIFLILFRCGNPENLWSTREQTMCLDRGMVYSFNVFAAAWQVVVYLFLAFFPMYIVWRLKMETRKYTIMTLLGLTTLTGVAASVKTAVSLTNLGEADRDSTWDIYVLSMWTATEIMLLIVCGSVLVMVPLWDNLVKSCRPRCGSASRGASGAGHSRPVWTTKEAGPTQTKQSVENADFEDLDVEEAELVGAKPKAITDLPSISSTKELLRYSSASTQGMVDRLSGRFHLWGRVGDQGASERHCNESAV